MKRPSFQFYPGDWLRDSALRSCSIGARGLWIDMLCYMHEGTPYGWLKVNLKVILPANLAAMTGLTLEATEGYLEELETAGVFHREPCGCIVSRRMVRDESLRAVRAAGGKLGGNPSLKVNLKDNLKVENKVKQNPTPSSSSSSSSSSANEELPLSLNIGKSKSRATIEDVCDFCRSIGLTGSDGESMFWKWEGNGWTNNGKQLKDWKAVIRQWKAGGWMPSQKNPTTNGGSRPLYEPFKNCTPTGSRPLYD